jgi:hypothetical protein
LYPGHTGMLYSYTIGGQTDQSNVRLLKMLSIWFCKEQICSKLWPAKTLKRLP